ncbi:MAG: TSUP family transporter, partial [Ilumatobacteraceae bacterium]
ESLTMRFSPLYGAALALAVIIPTSIMGTWRNWKADNIDLKVAAIVGFGGIPSAVAGGVIADHMSQDVSNILFASLVLVVAMRMIFDLRRDSTN